MLLLAHNPTIPDLECTTHLEKRAGFDKCPDYLAAKAKLPPGQTFMVYLMATIYANRKATVK